MWGGWCGVVGQDQVGVVSEVVDMLLCWQSKSKEATPVTLACEDDQRLDKVILAAISPFLDDMLSGSKHTHPLIYLGGFH